MKCLYCGKYPIFTRGRCRKCYDAYHYSNDFERVTNHNEQCSECERPARANGMCQRHYMQFYNERKRQEEG